MRKESVTLRKRKMPSGNTSLYLDIYKGGRRSYEYLHLYLVPERTRKEKEKNKETFRIAEEVAAKRLLELRSGEYGTRGTGRDTSLYGYYMSLMEERKADESRTSWTNWRSCLKHMEAYESGLKSMTLADVTTKWVEGFRRYLLTEATPWENDHLHKAKDRRLSTNTASSYFKKLKACMSQAVHDGLITRNPMDGVESIRQEDPGRMYLTVEELRRLASTPCEYTGIRRAFLFSCLTGLRRSDIMALRWGDVQRQGGFTRLFFSQRKTGGREYLDISPSAVKLMGDRGGDSEPVFTGILSPSGTNTVLRRWVADAGIRKRISFHCGRHTFAVMMLDLGTDIYTVSKLLGHTSLAATQVYAKVLDRNKQAAVERIPDVLGGDERE